MKVAVTLPGKKFLWEITSNTQYSCYIALCLVLMGESWWGCSPLIQSWGPESILPFDITCCTRLQRLLKLPKYREITQLEMGEEWKGKKQKQEKKQIEKQVVDIFFWSCS